MESASNSGTRVGYTRVSTVAQTLDQQNTALAGAGVTKTFSDTMSGAKDDRPGLAALMDYVRAGDTAVVCRPLHQKWCRRTSSSRRLRQEWCSADPGSGQRC